MKILAKYHVCNHCVIGEKTLKNILTGPGKLPGLSRNGSRALETGFLTKRWLKAGGRGGGGRG